MLAQQEEYICKNCKKQTKPVVDVQEGNVTCTNCGLTLENRCIDPTPEWRNIWIFADGNSSGADPRRIGAALNPFSEQGLQLDIRGSMANESTRLLSKLTDRLNTTEDRSLVRGMQKLRDWIQLLNLNQTILQKAEEQFTKLEANKKSLKGRNVESLAAAILFIASRQCKCPIKPNEISNATSVAVKDIRNAYKFVKQYIDYVPHMSPTHYGRNFAAKLQITNDIINAITETITRIESKGIIDGRNPRTIAAAAIYMVSALTPDQKKTLKEISEVACIAENTIKTSYKDLFAHRYIILPEWKGRQPLDNLNQ